MAEPKKLVYNHQQVQERERNFFDNAPLPYFVLTTDALIKSTNAAANGFLNGDMGLQTYDNLLDFISEEFKHPIKELLLNFNEYSNNVTQYFSLYRPDNTLVKVRGDFAYQNTSLSGEITVMMLLTDQEKSYSVNSLNVTSREETIPFFVEGNLYEKLYESMMDGFALVDMQGMIVEFNKVFREMIAYSEEEIYKLTYQEITPGKWHVFELDIVNNQVLKNGHSDVYEKEYRRKDGTIIPVELRTKLVKDDAGQAIGMWAIVRDVSKRKQTEDRLIQREKQYRLLVENQTDFIVEVGLNGKIVYASPSFLSLLGLGEEKKINAHFRKLVVKEDHLILKESVKAVTQPPYICSFSLRIKSHLGWRSIAWSTKALLDIDNKPTSFVGIGRDISFENRIAKEVKQKEIMHGKSIERRRIYSDLHDHLGNLTVSNKLRLERCIIMNSSSEIKYDLKNALDVHLRLMKEIRQYSTSLSKENSIDVDLKVMVTKLLDDFEQVKNLRMSRRIEDVFHVIPNEKRISVFRILEEALTNVIKHSLANKIIVQFYLENDQLLMSVSNDGVLGAGSNRVHGNGLNFMRKRAKFIGAKLDIFWQKKDQFQVILTLPY